jgi:hypothetical protein
MHKTIRTLSRFSSNINKLPLIFKMISKINKGNFNITINKTTFNFENKLENPGKLSAIFPLSV